MKRLAFTVVLIWSLVPAFGQQGPESSDKLSSWLLLQAVPSLTWTTFPAETHFAFEWEATPVLYSFGLTNLVSPWKSFFVVPTARFTGSVELNVTGQVYVSKVGTSHFGFSGQLLAHIPVIERGEDLALNVGVARYEFGSRWSTFGVAGVSTLFGLVHYNIKYSPKDEIWMNSIEIRLF